jgi:hypothetical protein
MNPTSKSPLRVVQDPIAAAINAQLMAQLKAKDEVISEKDTRLLYLQLALATSEMRAQKLEEELRLERIKKYGKQSEKLSDLQLRLLDLEPAVSSDEIKAESERDPLPESTESRNANDKKRRSRQNHSGRNDLPAGLERIDKIIPCAPEFCTCGECGGDTKVIGYDVSEVLDRKPAAYFVTRIMREKRVSTPRTKTCSRGPRPARIASSRVSSARRRRCASRPSRSFPTKPSSTF